MLTQTSSFHVGVDIGGTHIYVGFMDMSSTIIESIKYNIDGKTLLPDLAIQKIVDTIHDFHSKNPNSTLLGVGICCPGQSKEGVLIAAANLPLFINAPFCELIAKHLNYVQVTLVNDADAAICAELFSASNKSMYQSIQNAAIITVGTGIGVGLIINRRLHAGTNSLIEAGHMIINHSPDAPLCGCGQRGCAEVYCSAANTAKRLMEADLALGADRGAYVGKPYSAKEAFERAEQGDAVAIGVINVAIEALAVLCINLCRTVDPEVIILAGGVSGSGESFRAKVEKEVRRLTWTVLPTEIKIVLGNVIEHAGMIGAALSLNASERASPVSTSLQHQKALSNIYVKESISLSNVESYFIRRSGLRPCYSPIERIPSIEVENVYELGKLVALRFIEWVHYHPTGIVALPTGRTPEYFIKTLEKLRSTWNNPVTRKEMRDIGLDLNEFPSMSELKFVMLDEFFPMLPTHRNSFCLYIEKFYTSALDIPSKNVHSFDLIRNNVLSNEEMSLFQDIDVDLKLLEINIDTMSLSKEQAQQRSVLMKVDNFCKEFEARIRSMGGIGFFLGGIGPDGHIAFNQPGCSLDSITRLVSFNYPTAAAAASDLGGIEIARGKAAMTIGLGTISFNPNATVIIMAAGEGKADVVRAAIEEESSVDRPASILQQLSGARMYITHGSGSKLTARIALRIAQISDKCKSWVMNYLAGVNTPYGIDLAHLTVPPLEYNLLETCIYNASLKIRVPVHELTLQQIDNLPELETLPSWVREATVFPLFTACACRRLKEKIEGGLRASSPTGANILHTAPHHDDIMLSYHAAMHYMLGRQPNLTAAALPVISTIKSISSLSEVRTVASPPFSGSPLALLRKRTSSESVSRGPQLLNALKSFEPYGEKYNGNVNHFAYLTSGFHSVNDSFLKKQVESIVGSNGEFELLVFVVNSGDLTRSYDGLLSEFKDAFLEKDLQWQDRIENIIFLRKVCEVWSISLTESYPKLIALIKTQLNWMRNDFFINQQPGDAVPKNIQLLKGCMRESEVDRVWCLSNMPNNRVHHLRSKFYTDDFFTPLPSVEDDALPMANLIRAKQPEVITVAFDPEGTGPDTHYKVLLVVAAGLRIALERGDLTYPNPVVWGYRNVWFVFTPADATLMIPGSAEDLDLMHDTFMSCFTTQKTASFPSPSYDGPFSAWARHLQIEQKKILVCLLGENYFRIHPDPRVRQSKGFVFLRAMDTATFLHEVEGLKSKFENVTAGQSNTKDNH